MEFDQLVLNKLGSTFNEYGLITVEQRSDYIKLQSNCIEVVISHNKYEKSNTIWLGSIEEQREKVEIDNEALVLFFNSELKLSNVSMDTFLSNLVVFFTNLADQIMCGEQNELVRLEEFDLERSDRFTSKLVLRQTVAVASIAWENKDYEKFVKLVEKLDLEQLPQSIKLKYYRAKKIIKN
jgi:hypothetical protein